MPPSFAGMIDLYLTREVGERMGEGCSDLLKDKRGLPSLGWPSKLETRLHVYILLTSECMD